MQDIAVRFVTVLIGLLLFAGDTLGHVGSKSGLTDLIAEPEARLLESIEQVTGGEVSSGINTLEALIRDQPNFRLANLLYAELLAVKAGRSPMVTGSEKGQSKIADLIEEARRRYQHGEQFGKHHHNMLPDSILKVSPSQEYVVVIDSALSRAHVYKNELDGLQLIEDYCATLGKRGLSKLVEGDKKTPVGVYFITSQLNPMGLDDLYGDGALPLNYPNEWDQQLGRTGYGIWLHGVPSDTYNRAPYATEGCIALPNDDISNLYNAPGILDTPVIVSPSINWVATESVQTIRQRLLGRIEGWRASWLQHDLPTYAAFYSNRFFADSMENLVLISDQESITSSLSVAISDISLFKYPATRELIVATFNLVHWSGGEELSMRVRQYWQLESDNQWRIVYQGPSDYKPEHFKGIPEKLVPVMANN